MIAPTCFGPFGPSSGSPGLPDDGPNGPKHVGAIMRYFNCIF